jgi:pimeloyl-ACP methyl ester carboxylesterase/alkylhydroperoxidase family enzyme
MSSLRVNGTTLYYELRGQGPAVVFISGAGGDAGMWLRVAETLADEFTVLTYDRRANSRSPRSDGWDVASVDQQADDAAELVTALGLEPAAGYGSSAGAMILTSLTLRRPEVLCGAIFHEPPFTAVTSDGVAVGKDLAAVVSQGMAAGGPPAAMKRFLRWVGGDAAFEAFDDELRARLVRNGEIFFGAESKALHSYLPGAEQLAEIRLPCLVAAGFENIDPAAPRHWLYEAAQWFADQLDAPFIDTPGAHLPQATHAQVLAEGLRPFLRTLTRARDKVPAGGSGARIGPPDRASLPTEVRSALERMPNLIHFNLLAHASSAFLQRIAYGETLRHRLTLPAKVRELATLRVTALAGCPYNEMWHRNLAAKVGADAGEILAVLRPELDPAAFAPPEAAALTFVDEMVNCRGAGPAAVAGVLAHFSERELVELGLVVDRYLGLSLLLNSLGVEPVLPARETDSGDL